MTIKQSVYRTAHLPLKNSIFLFTNSFKKEGDLKLRYTIKAFRIYMLSPTPSKLILLAND